MSARSDYEAAYDALRRAEAVYEAARAAWRGSSAVCQECDRTFVLSDPDQAREWFYGHDCEVGL